jgi:hypothetical protein
VERKIGRRGCWGGELDPVVVDRRLRHLRRRGGGLRGHVRNNRGVGSDGRGRGQMGCCIGRCGSGGLVGGRGGSAVIS